jgi:hypothetical protein
VQDDKYTKEIYKLDAQERILDYAQHWKNIGQEIRRYDWFLELRQESEGHPEAQKYETCLVYNSLALEDGQNYLTISLSLF